MDDLLRDFMLGGDWVVALPMGGIKRRVEV